MAAKHKKHNKNDLKTKKNEQVEVNTAHWKIYAAVVFAVVCMAAVLAVVFLNQDKGPAEKAFPGRWEATNSYDLKVVFDVNSDHTLKYYVSDNLEYDGTWSYQRYSNLSKITMDIDAEEVGKKELYLIQNDETDGELILTYDTEDFTYAFHKTAD